MPNNEPGKQAMRILFLTNFYQIAGSGGEEQSCQQVVEGLQQRGHQTLVLTSMQGTNNVPREADGLSRSLYLEMDLVPWRNSLLFFAQREERERRNLERLERVFDRFQPDVVFIWGMWNLPRSLATRAEARYPDRVVYRFATYWPTLPSQSEAYWRAPAQRWYSRLLKQAVGRVALTLLARQPAPPPLAFRHAICVSAAARDTLVQGGVPVGHARIIYTGLDPQPYLNGRAKPRPSPAEGSLELLYAGRLTAEKGVDTIISALCQLAADPAGRRVRLSLAGSADGAYARQLRQRASAAGLDDYVSFLGWVPPEAMPDLLRQFDVLVFPSAWPEPFSRIVLQGMLSGLAVLATPAGGTSEVVVDGVNGLLFPAGDAQALVRQIVRLAADPSLRQRLAQAGRQTVLSRFTQTRMLDEIESYLQAVVAPVRVVDEVVA